jgi:ribosomal protein S18 acetylase RimI-like enzyme
MSELSTNPNSLNTIANTANIARAIAFERHQIEIRAVREDEIHCVADIITRSFHFDRGWMRWFTPLFKLGIAEDLRHRLRSHVSSSSQGKVQQQVCSIALYADREQSQVVGTIEVGVRTTSSRAELIHIGAASPLTTQYWHDRRRYVYISNLAVSQDFRRRGVAQELLNNCEQLTKSWGYSELHLHVMGNNERGRNLYRKLGYEIVSSESIWSIIPWHRPERLFLRKQL